ncbi:histidine phosphatase family protein [Kitasatospora sp. NPDC004745]|uniref:histidine phosphatase family protein n=1 Tax=unclassified Kitasatospora TaxID=2633591 RepID=UPI0034020B39
MTVRVTLVSPAMSSAVREARFDDDAPLDASGLAAARSAAGTLPAPGTALSSPSARCRQTAAALGLTAAPHEALRGCAMGSWRGLRLDEVAAERPEQVAAWLADPAAAPHGGESLQQLGGRVGGWLDGLAAESGRVVAVVEPDVVRAAVVHALDLPAPVFWRLDVPPLAFTVITGRAGRWNLRLGGATAGG